MKNREYYINLLKVEQMMSDDNYQYLELCEFSKAEHLLHQGQILEYLYILVSGRIKSCRTTANGTTVLSAFSNPITVTGEVEFLNHHEVTNDVYALKNTVCFRISVAQYEDILLHDLIFMRYLARTLSNRLYPVSYTHLRAHETGRNLVCRLLLEKKKKKITFNIIIINLETKKNN